MDSRRLLAAMVVTAAVLGAHPGSDAQPAPPPAIGDRSVEPSAAPRGSLEETSPAASPAAGEGEAARKAVERYIERGLKNGIFRYTDPQTLEEVELRYEGLGAETTESNGRYRVAARFTELNPTIAEQRFTPEGEGAAFTLHFFAEKQRGGYEVIGFDR